MVLPRLVQQGESSRVGHSDRHLVTQLSTGGVRGRRNPPIRHLQERIDPRHLLPAVGPHRVHHHALIIRRALNSSQQTRGRHQDKRAPQRVPQIHSTRLKANRHPLTYQPREKLKKFVGPRMPKYL